MEGAVCRVQSLAASSFDMVFELLFLKHPIKNIPPIRSQVEVQVIGSLGDT